MKQTLDQSGTILRQVFDDDIPTPVSQISVQRRLVCILCYVVSNLDNPAGALTQKLNFIAASILEQEPGGFSIMLASSSRVAKVSWRCS